MRKGGSSLPPPTCSKDFGAFCAFCLYKKNEPKSQSHPGMSVPRAGAGGANPPPPPKCLPPRPVPFLPHTGGCASPPAAVNRFVGGSAAPLPARGSGDQNMLARQVGGGSEPFTPWVPPAAFWGAALGRGADFIRNWLELLFFGFFNE